MKTGKITNIHNTQKGRYIDIQVRQAGTVTTYSVKTDADVRRGETVVVPKEARIVEEFNI